MEVEVFNFVLKPRKRLYKMRAVIIPRKIPNLSFSSFFVLLNIFFVVMKKGNLKLRVSIFI